MRKAILRACDRLDAGEDPLIVSRDLRRIAELADVDPRPGLSKKQRAVLDVIEAHVARYGYTPTLQRIADGLGLRSIATVHEHMRALKEKGYLSRDHKSKSFTLLPRPVTHA